MYYAITAAQILSFIKLIFAANIMNLFTLEIIFFIFLISVFLLLIYLQYWKFRNKNLLLEKKINERNEELKKSRSLLLTELEERLQAEEELRISQRQLSEVWEKSSDGMRITDENGIIIKVNDAFCRMVEKSRTELEGKPFSVIYQKMDQEAVLKIYNERFNSKSIETFYEREFTLWNNTKVWFEVSSSFLEFKDNPSLLLLIFRNVTDRKNEQYALQKYAKELEKVNRKLLKSEDQLKELNANKDKFFSIISHDLRSPFNSILGFSDILVNEFDTISDQEKRSFALSINKSTKNLYNLLDGLLQWSRLQTGQVEFTPLRINLKSIVENTLELLIGNALLKNITIYNDIESTVFVFADEKMISSVFQNLISNAIKFTMFNGEIKISSSCDADFAEISIKDNGIGIKPQDFDNLFSFRKNVQDGTAMEKGSGLGLVICKEFVEMNGGKIAAESCVEKGTKFKFTIPISKTHNLVN